MRPSHDGVPSERSLLVGVDDGVPSERSLLVGLDEWAQREPHSLDVEPSLDFGKNLPPPPTFISLFLGLPIPTGLAQDLTRQLE
jgi:hypothetical protein